MSTVKTIADFLDRELDTGAFDDLSHNGLQVANSGRVGTVCSGVDASMEFFEAARRRGAGLIICHHGLSWGDSLKRITDLNYRRLAFLIQNDMALYASHLPLDAHPRHGNNALICRAMGLRELKPFGLYQGRKIGFEGRLPRPLSYEAFKKRAARQLGRDVQSMDFGKKTVRRVAVVSGGAAGEIEEAGCKGVDVFLSGEPALPAYRLAQEYGIHAIFGGHYATEVFGVRALADVVRRRFGVKAEFIDLRVPY